MKSESKHLLDYHHDTLFNLGVNSSVFNLTSAHLVALAGANPCVCYKPRSLLVGILVLYFFHLPTEIGTFSRKDKL